MENLLVLVLSSFNLLLPLIYEQLLYTTICHFFLALVYTYMFFGKEEKDMGVVFIGNDDIIRVVCCGGAGGGLSRGI